MKFTRIAASIALAMAASTAFAGNYIDVGFEENEVKTNDADGKNGNFYQTYVAVNFEPIEGSPFKIFGSMSNLQADDPDNRESWNRLRRQLYVGYKWNFGDLTFAPMAGIRHHTYDHDAKRRDTEVRFFPGLSYAVSDSTNVYLGGYMSTIPTRNADRSADRTGEYKNYNDYKHELELGVKQKLASGDYFKVGIFNELDKFEGKTVDSTDLDDDGFVKEVGEGMNQWMLRLAYGTKLSDQLSVEAIARFDIKRDKKYVGLESRDEKRNRYGVNFGYKLDQDWKIHGMAYYQTEDNKAHDANGSVIDADDTGNKIVYSLQVRRSF